MLDWYRLPGCPDGVSVHVAPFERDLPDAMREASGKRPDVIVLDTEGSPRPGLAFAEAKPDLVITPLASSALEANQAVKAAEMVRNASLKLRRPLMHRCLLTRLPAAFRPRSLRSVVEILRTNGIEILTTPLIEKEAFRSLFFVGGGLEGLATKGAPGLESARINAEAYVQEVSELLGLAPAAAQTGT
jgi:chromosome partitioning protein